MIHAEVRSDDGVRLAHFDATPWFEQAESDELVALRDCGWGGDYAADEVAEFIAGDEEHVSEVFDYAWEHGKMGYECRVNEADAARWVREHRPDWFWSLWPAGFDAPPAGGG